MSELTSRHFPGVFRLSGPRGRGGDVVQTCGDFDNLQACINAAVGHEAWSWVSTDGPTPGGIVIDARRRRAGTGDKAALDLPGGQAGMPQGRLLLEVTRVGDASPFRNVETVTAAASIGPVKTRRREADR